VPTWAQRPLGSRSGGGFRHPQRRRQPARDPVLRSDRPAGGLLADRWSLELYVKNLDDELGRTSMFGDVGTFPNDALASGVIRPRTIGLTASFGFLIA
jgi:hypothetical protein